MSPEEKKGFQLPQHLAVALNSADTSSGRARRIVFFIQITAVLVIAGLWQETSYNWVQLRLKAARNAEAFLSCEPQNAYVPPQPDPPVRSTDDKRPPADIDTIKAVNKAIGVPKSPATMNPEELERAFNCAAHPLTNNERTQAQEFLNPPPYSLSGTQQYIADLEKTSDRVSVPILGISFDINDLSIIGGLAFGILLSWFYFNLRRELQDVKTVFDIARECDGHAAGQQDGEAKRREHATLKAAYALLRMSQVLAVPPSEDRDDRNTSLSRSLTRIPNLILWTPVVAELAVLINDFITLKEVDYLHPLVNRAETAIAVYLFVYIIFRTVECFILQQETEEQWINAWNEVNEHNPQQKITTFKKPWFAQWVKESRLTLSAATLFIAVTLHFLDEWWPGILTAKPLKILARMWITAAPWIADHRRALTLAMLVLLAFAFILSLVRRNFGVGLAWTFTFLALLDVTVHNLMAAAAAPHFTENMQGFYSSPLLVIAALLFWFSLWHARVDRKQKEKAKPDGAPGEVLTKRAAMGHRD